MFGRILEQTPREKVELETILNSYRITTFAKAPSVLRQDGLENSLLRLARTVGISSLEEFILYNRWGFERKGESYRFKTLAIAPDEVSYTNYFPFDIRGENAIVGEGGGPWYRCVQPFDQSRLFRAMRDRFVEGKKWEETEMYRVQMHRLSHREKVWNGCTTPEEIDERCKFIEDLYDDIKENGYRTQEELRAAAHHDDEKHYYRNVNGVTFPDELRVAIGPDGQLIRADGAKHRLAIAKLLGLDEIPAVVQIQHEQFRLWDTDNVRVGRLSTATES